MYKLVILIFMTLGIDSHKEDILRLTSFPACNNVRTGSYYYNAKLDGGTTRVNIFRTDSTQVELTKDDKKIAVYSVFWIDSCTYEMKLIEQIQPIPSSQLDLKKKMVLKTHILTTTPDYYIYNSTINIFDKEITDTVWIQK